MSKVQALVGKVRFSKRGDTLLFALLNSTMVVILAVVCAIWTWALLAPSPMPTPAVLPDSAPVLAPTIAAARWFGGGGKATDVAAQNVSYKLIGVYASQGDRPGFAILQQADGKQVSVVLHQNVAPGLALNAITADSVTLDGGGVPVTLKLEVKPGSGKSGPRVGP